MRHICLYIGVQIFSAGGCAGPPEVVQEALADLKNMILFFNLADMIIFSVRHFDPNGGGLS